MEFTKSLNIFKNHTFITKFVTAVYQSVIPPTKTKRQISPPTAMTHRAVIPAAAAVSARCFNLGGPAQIPVVVFLSV